MSSIVTRGVLVGGALIVEIDIECFNLSLLSDLINSGFVMVCACMLMLVATGCCCIWNNDFREKKERVKIDVESKEDSDYAVSISLPVYDDEILEAFSNWSLTL